MSYCLSLKKFVAENMSFKMSDPPSARVQAHVEMKVYIWATSAILKQKETAYLQVKKQQYSNWNWKQDSYPGQKAAKFKLKLETILFEGRPLKVNLIHQVLLQSHFLNCAPKSSFLGGIKTGKKWHGVTPFKAHAQPYDV